MKRGLLSSLADNTDPRSLSSAMRRERFQWFRRALGVAVGDRILDVGGSADAWLGTGLEGQVTVLNLSVPETDHGIAHVAGDACHMDFYGQAAFDVIYSNSVIEHVGDLGRQQRFASEVARVGRRYWVQTPWRHFPLEAHMLFPFFQYLTPALQRWLARRWPYSHFGPDCPTLPEELSRLRLLTRREFSRLFPGARIAFERLLGVPKSLIAYRT